MSSNQFAMAVPIKSRIFFFTCDLQSSAQVAFTLFSMPGVKHALSEPVGIPKELMRFGRYNFRYRHFSDYLSPKPTHRPYFQTPKFATPKKCNVVLPFKPTRKITQCHKRHASIEVLPLPKSDLTVMKKKPKNGISQLQDRIASLEKSLAEKDNEVKCLQNGVECKDHELEVLASSKMQIHHEAREWMKRCLDVEHAFRTFASKLGTCRCFVAPRSLAAPRPRLSSL